MSNTIQSIRGMHDVLPGDISLWHTLESVIRDAMHAYAYAELRTPLVERTDLFKRSIGEVTDIVEKEMYTFESRGGTSLSLRPEATASCVRAALQHGLLQSGSASRIWYLGPMFRYERPQKGRARQFHQAGAEVYGVAGPRIEAELVLLSARLLRAAGVFDSVQLEINSLGSSDDRTAYRATLVDFFNDHAAELDEDSQRRLKTNPLRILDSKNPALANMLELAPALADHLSEESAEHFAQLQSLLAASGISAVVNDKLVRGLDYYSHTVFEWTTEKLGAQAAVCAGGRYDGLIEQLGGKPCPGVGWAMGVERMIALMQLHNPQSQTPGPDVFVIVAADVAEEHGLAVSEWLRSSLPGLAVEQSASQSSLKNQFKRADKSRARFAVVLGQQELDQGTLTLKPLRVQQDAAIATGSTGASDGQSQQVTETRENILQRLVSATPFR